MQKSFCNKKKDQDAGEDKQPTCYSVEDCHSNFFAELITYEDYPQDPYNVQGDQYREAKPKKNPLSRYGSADNVRQENGEHRERGQRVDS